MHVRESRDRVDQDVEALARDEAADPEDEWTIGIESEGTARRGPRRRVEGAKPVDVDAGRDDHPAQRSARGPLGFPRRIVPGRNDTRGSPEDARPS